MTFPNRCSVTIDGVETQALAANFELRSTRDGDGAPAMGGLATGIGVWVDLHDKRNLPFTAFAELFRLANRATKEKIVPIQLDFWDDEAHRDVVCSFSFDGWISLFRAESPKPGGDGDDAGANNHVLYLELEPKVDEQAYRHIEVTN